MIVRTLRVRTVNLCAKGRHQASPGHAESRWFHSVGALMVRIKALRLLSAFFEFFSSNDLTYREKTAFEVKSF